MPVKIPIWLTISRFSRLNIVPGCACFKHHEVITPPHTPFAQYAMMAPTENWTSKPGVRVWPGAIIMNIPATCAACSTHSQLASLILVENQIAKDASAEALKTPITPNATPANPEPQPNPSATSTIPPLSSIRRCAIRRYEDAKMAKAMATPALGAALLLVAPVCATTWFAGLPVVGPVPPANSSISDHVLGNTVSRPMSTTRPKAAKTALATTPERASLIPCAPPAKMPRPESRGPPRTPTTTNSWYLTRYPV
mmetsp:Transcript_4778/g.10526  ORF Transcript_4778/g.10526 Transcript_4778/m.10526 type:complete len:254 (-) Transcript_4778:406-1167(-)